MGYCKPIIDRLIIFLYPHAVPAPLGPLGPLGFSEEVHRQQLRQSAPWRSELRIADGLGRTRPWRKKNVKIRGIVTLTNINYMENKRPCIVVFTY